MSPRQTLVDAALEALRRDVPEELNWLFQTPPPRLHWRDDGQAVDQRVVKGWLVLADERCNPMPGDRQRRQAQLIDPADGGELALWLLQAWIAHESPPPPVDAARRQELHASARQAAALAARLGRGGSDPDARFAQLLAQESNRPASSSWPHRGLLALVQLCADPRIAAPISAYLDRWRSSRPRRCRAMERLLASLKLSVVPQ